MRDTQCICDPLAVNGLGAGSGHAETAAHPRASAMNTARAWASSAGRDELKAHAVAAWEAMGALDRAAFCRFLRLEAVAAVMARPETVE